MSQEKKNTSFLVYLLLIPAIVGGFALIRDGWKEYEFGQETASWAKTTGTILKKGVLDSDRSGRHEFTPRVTYTYEVGGRTHEGHLISRKKAGRYSSRREAEAQIEAFEPGTDVDVYYDPDSPSRSCLVPGDHGDGIAFMLVGAAIVAICLFIIYIPMLKGYLRRQFVDRRLNIALKAPWGWRRLPASGSSGPLVAFARKHIRCALNAAAADRDVLPSADTVATQRLDIIAEYSTSHEVLTREPALIDGREGVLIEVTARENKSEFLYTGFCMAHRGFRRELLVYGKKKSLSRRQARETLEEFVRRLEVLEPERFSYQALPPVTKPFVSKIYGYRFTPRKGWRRWRTVSSDLPDAEAGFLHDRGLVLSLLPVALPDGNPPREAVVAGLLTLYEVDDSDPTLTPLPHSSNRLAYRFERTVGETAYAYRFHFDFWQGVACMAAVAGEADNPFLDEVMDQVSENLLPPEETCPPTPIEDLPGSSKAREAKVLARMGMWFAQRQRDEEAIAYFEAARARAPRDSGYLENLMMALTRARRYREALKLLDDCKGEVQMTIALQSFRPFLLARMGRKEEAVQAYEKVFALGWRDQNDAADYIDLLLELGRTDDARSAVDRMRKGGEVLWVHQLAARIHRSEDKCEEAVSILRSYAEARPGDREAKLALLEELTSCKREEEAIALADTYITGGRGDAGFLLRRGIAECQLGRFPHAKRTFENALELEPHDVSLQNWLDHATRELGQGSNQLIRRPLPPLDLPAAHEPTKNELSAFRDEAAVYADSTVVYEFRRGESLTWTARDVIHILTAKGVEEFSTIRQPFDPESQEFFVNEVRVRDEKGDTVSVGRLEDYFVKDDDSREAKSSKVVNIPVVGLAPGRTLEYVRTRRLHGSPQRFDYRRIPLGAPSPIMRSMVEVGGDIEDIQIKTAGEPVEDRSPHRLRIVAKDLPACPVESYAPRADTWQPMVWLSEASGTWEEVAREYLAKIEERLQVSEEIEKLARTLTEGAADARDRAQALSAWVQRKIHYKSIAFGPKAWLPERPEKVLEACWGDCKGHALLFHHLMKAVGLRAHLALVSTSDVGWPELPSTWQFDHMINYCPDLDDGRFVDCVDKGWGWDASVPSGLDRQPSLVLDPEAPRLLQIPAHGDTENLIELDRDVICEADGTLKVSEVLRAHANLGGFLRRWLLGMAGGERAQAVASWLQQMDPRIAFERVAIESLEDTGAPIALRLAYGISRGLEELDGRRVGKAPAPLERCYLVPPVSTCRRAPVEIAMPYLVKSRSRIRPSDSDTTLEAPSLTDASGEDRFTRWSSQARSAEGGLEITGEIATLRGRHPAERYEEFRASTLAAVESLQVRIVVT